jgi:glycosyltransferase involved in cell wall biosynthesis
VADRPILIVAGEYPPDVGGVADYTAHLRDALRSRGRRVRVLARTQHGTPDDPSIYRRVGRWNALGVRQIVKAVRSRTIVHIQYQAAAFDLLGDICLAPLLLRALRPGVRVTTTFHDARVPFVFPKAGPVRPLSIRVMAQASHAVLAADGGDLRALGGPSPRHNCVPIGSNVPCHPPEGYDRAAFRAGLGLDPGSIVVAYFGLLNSSKGLDTLLDAFHLIEQEHPNAWLLLLGGAVGASDPTDRTTAAVFERRLRSTTDHVLRPGYADAELLSAYLLAADLAVLPYADGASGRRGSLLACAEHGLPIVSTTGPGLTTSALDLDGAILTAPPADPRQLAQATLRVVTDPIMRERLRAGSASIARRASWSAIAERHLAIYSGLT